MAKTEAVIVSAGGQRDQHNARIIAQVISDGVAKGWTFIAVVNDFEENVVVFTKPATEKRG